MNILINLVVILFTIAINAQNKPYLLTVPDHKPLTEVSELRIFPAIQVPTNPEKFLWKTAKLTTFSGKKIDGQIAVYSFSNDGSKSVIGNINENTIIKLEVFSVKGNIIYYEIPWTTKSGKKIFAWVSGKNIYAAGRL